MVATTAEYMIRMRSESDWYVTLTRIRIYKFFFESSTSLISSIRVLHETLVKSEDRAFPDIWTRVIQHGNELCRDISSKFRRDNMR